MVSKGVKTDLFEGLKLTLKALLFGAEGFKANIQSEVKASLFPNAKLSEDMVYINEI
jgi:hypothetical protein